MPRLDDSYLKSVVFLYPSLQAAEDGDHLGGTGFLMGSPVANQDRIIVTSLLCLVTNKHVIDQGNTVVRTNTHDGKLDFFDIDERNCIPHPDGDDLIVYPLGLAWRYPYPFMDAGALNCVNRKSIEGLDVGIGDEVFTVGRFVSRAGKKINIPALRFGNISQMPIEPIEQDNGFKQESYLVEVRSLAGSSGSPVFLYIPAQPSLDHLTPESQNHILRQSHLLRGKRRKMTIPFGPMLLGVSYCYIYGEEPVMCEKTGKQMHDWYVRSNSGMMGVIPAWKLTEMILGKPLMNVVEEAEKELHAKQRQSGVKLTSTASPLPASDANPTHREDFTRLVGAAARKPQQDD